jgi:hypothetical protein
VFDLYGNDRLTEWKKFRDSLETVSNPLEEVSKLWSRAPFVNHYLDPQCPSEWPDPWHLILDGKLDDLAICLGMLYTIKLTQRFMATVCEIHMSMLPKDSSPRFYLVVDNTYVLNYEPRKIHDLTVLQDFQTNTIWRCDQLL